MQAWSLVWDHCCHWQIREAFRSRANHQLFAAPFMSNSVCSICNFCYEGGVPNGIQKVGYSPQHQYGQGTADWVGERSSQEHHYCCIYKNNKSRRLVRWQQQHAKRRGNLRSEYRERVTTVREYLFMPETMEWCQEVWCGGTCPHWV